MTYIELYEKATRQLEKSEITLGEYEEMIEPLKREILITCKDCENWDKRRDRGDTCYCGMRMRHTEPDEFCDDAMRRESK